MAGQLLMSIQLSSIKVVDRHSTLEGRPWADPMVHLDHSKAWQCLIKDLHTLLNREHLEVLGQVLRPNQLVHSQNKQSFLS